MTVRYGGCRKTKECTVFNQQYFNLTFSDHAYNIASGHSHAIDLPIVAEFGIRSPSYMAREGTTLTVPIDLVNGELGVFLTVEVSCNSNTATSKGVCMLTITTYDCVVLQHL